MSGANGNRASAGDRPDPLAPYLAYVSERLGEDPHVWATALWDKVRGLGYTGAYSSFTEALRRRQLRPHREACSGVRGRVAEPRAVQPHATASHSPPQLSIHY